MPINFNHKPRGVIKLTGLCENFLVISVWNFKDCGHIFEWFNRRNKFIIAQIKWNGGGMFLIFKNFYRSSWRLKLCPHIRGFKYLKLLYVKFSELRKSVENIKPTLFIKINLVLIKLTMGGVFVGIFR